MRRKFVLLHQLLIVMLCLVMSSGCAVSDSAVEADPKAWSEVRLIIKFTDKLTQAQVLEKLSAMEGEYSVKLLWVRAMSGDAHVIKAVLPVGKKDVKAFLEMVQNRADVTYVEYDAMMHHQKGF